MENTQKITVKIAKQNRINVNFAQPTFKTVVHALHQNRINVNFAQPVFRTAIHVLSSVPRKLKLNDLLDVFIVGVGNGETLIYNSITKKFENKLMPGNLTYDSDYDCFLVG